MKIQLVVALLGAACTHGCADVPEVAPLKPAVAAQIDPSSHITITPGLVFGTGCEEGSYDIFDFPTPSGGRVYQINPRKYRLSTDGKPATQTQYCDIQFEVSAAKGKRFALSRVQFAGSVTLQPGARAEVELEYGFKDIELLPTRQKTLSFVGPHGLGDDPWDWLYPDEQFVPLQFSPCGASRIVELKTGLNLTDPQRKPGSGITFEEASGTFEGERPAPSNDDPAVVVEFAQDDC